MSSGASFPVILVSLLFFFSNDTATTEIYTLSLHDALPIWNHDHPAGPPAFRKRGAGLSVPFPGQAVEVRKLSRRWAEVRLPKVGCVRFRLSRPLGGTVRNATISRDGLGWHIAFGVATGAKPAAPNGLPGCGVDFGVACSAFVSDEPEPRLMRPSLTPGEQRRLLGLELRKARQVRWAKRHHGGRYSNRLRRTIAEIAKLKARQARRRLDFTHKLTTDLAKRHGWVGIEDLQVKSMTRSVRGTAEAPGSVAASSPTRRHGTGPSCGLFRRLARRRPARPAGRAIRSPGRAAGGCSPAPPAAIRLMLT